MSTKALLQALSEAATAPPAENTPKVGSVFRKAYHATSDGIFQLREAVRQSPVLSKDVMVEARLEKLYADFASFTVALKPYNWD